MSGVLEIVGEIIWTILSESFKTLVHLFRLFLQLIKAANPLSASGPWGFLLSVLIIGGVVFILGKYVFHVGKNSILLIAFGIIVFVAVSSNLI